MENSFFLSITVFIFLFDMLHFMLLHSDLLHWYKYKKIVSDVFQMIKRLVHADQLWEN